MVPHSDCQSHTYAGHQQHAGFGVSAPTILCLYVQHQGLQQLCDGLCNVREQNALRCEQPVLM